ncbi:hypothetical protein RQP46_009971 [Phenoliferia psychrophenolica]
MAKASSTSPPARSSRVLLTELPPRVLRRIFDLARFEPAQDGSNGHLHGRVSYITKSLLPYSQSSLYSTVFIADWSALRIFCRTIRDRPDLRSTVKVLNLGLYECPCGKGETFDTGSPPDDVIVDMLERLVDVEMIVVSRGSRVAMLLLGSARLTQFSLRKLKFLRMEAVFGGGPPRWPNPFDLAMLASIQHYPSLTEWHLRICDDHEHTHITVPRARHNPLLDTPVSQITTLDLHGLFSSSSPLPLLGLLPSLRHLKFTDTSPTQSHVPLLSLLPLRLESLSIRSNAAPGKYASLDRVIGRFKQLKVLSLSMSSFPLSSLSSLYHLPLTSFGYESNFRPCILPFTPDDLQLLLEIIPTLKDIILNATYASRGEKLGDWFLSRWGAGAFRQSAAEDLVEFAKRRGVRVHGEILDTIEVEKAFFDKLETFEDPLPTLTVALVGLRIVGMSKPPPAPTDRFSTLPPELLDLIYSHLRATPRGPLSSSPRCTGALSRRLLPWTRSAMFHSLELRSESQVQLFSRSLRVEPDLGSLVKSLYIHNYNLWRHLNHLPLLTSLKIVSTTKFSMLMAPHELPHERNLTIRSLSLKGPISHPTARSLISHFGALETLVLEDTTILPPMVNLNLNLLLERLPSPDLLTSLTIHKPASSVSLLPIDEALSPFKNLLYLRIDGPQTHSSSFTAPPSLTRLELRHPFGSITDSTLLPFLASHPLLKVLHLDIASTGCRAPTIASRGGIPFLAPDGTPKAYPGWLAPTWSPFTLSGIFGLAKKLKEVGVALEGNVVVAMRIQVEMMNEARKLVEWKEAEEKKKGTTTLEKKEEQGGAKSPRRKQTTLEALEDVE